MAIDPWLVPILIHVHHITEYLSTRGKVIGKCDHKEDMILVDIGKYNNNLAKTEDFI